MKMPSINWSKLPVPSVYVLLVVGSLVMLLPMAAAMFYTGAQLDAHAGKQRLLQERMVRVTRAGVLSRDLVTDLERLALQYQTLGDEKLRTLFMSREARFDDVIQELRANLASDIVMNHVEPLAERVSALNKVISDPEASSEALEQATDRFSTAATLAENLNAAITQRVDELGSRAARELKSTRRNAAIIIVGILPLTLLLLAAFVVLVSRPLRRLFNAVRTLGHGDYDEPIAINGPQDLRELGDQLDWLRKELARMEAEKQRFIRHFSHELKTPLACLREGADQLHEELCGPMNQEQHEIVSILRSNALSLHQLIDKLLEFNLVGAGGDIQLETLEFSEFMRKTAANLDLLAKPRGVRIEYPQNRMTLHVDVPRFRTAIENILANAIRFTPDNQKVTVTLAADESRDQIEIHIDDEGPGFANEEAERLFEPFYQGQQQGTSVMKGTGLGLYLARECMREQRGNILATNKQEGGARFTIALAQQIKTLEESL